MFVYAFIAFFFDLKADLENIIYENNEPIIPLSFEHDLGCNFFQLFSSIEQVDNWSCGYRTLFNALSIEYASCYPESFEQYLYSYLKDESLLNYVFEQYNKEEPLSNFEIYEMAEKLGIADRVMILNYENEEIFLLGSISIQCDTGLNQEEKDELLLQERRRRLLEYTNNFAERVKQNKPIYIISGSEGHWILFSIVKINDNPAMLYLIDSANIGMRPERQKYVNFFMPHVNKINQYKNSNDYIFRLLEVKSDNLALEDSNIEQYATKMDNQAENYDWLFKDQFTLRYQQPYLFCYIFALLHRSQKFRPIFSNI